MKKNIAFYNIIFPFWLIFLHPLYLIFVIPCNFLIDSFVLFASMCFLKIENKKQFWLKSIWKIYLFGFAADIIGSIFAFFAEIFTGTVGFWLMIIAATFISAILIFFFNYRFSLRNCDKKLKFKLSIIFATATAPYVFLIPKELVFSSYWAFTIVLITFVAVIALFIISTSILLLFRKIKKNRIRKTLSATSALVFTIIIAVSIASGGMLLSELNKIEKVGVELSELSQEEKEITSGTFNIPNTEDSNIVKIFYCGSHELACVFVPEEQKISFIGSLNENLSKEDLSDIEIDNLDTKNYFTDTVNISNLKNIYRCNGDLIPTVFEYENVNYSAFIFEKYANRDEDLDFKKLFRSKFLNFFYEKFLI